MNCFRVQFEVEEQVELLKRRLMRRPKFDVGELFKYFDEHDFKVITRLNFKLALHKNKFYPTESELTWLTDRFDKKRNGRI
mmetsp:Transcript_14154/g.24053  ORF Transcript_14154/g.24053 Transcript_14154/m.24053 type:complete len:81 (-) Transcript_14154:109-351(-)